MDDLSRLKDGIPVTSVSERVWGVPRKRKAADGDSNRSPQRKGSERGSREEPDPEAEKEERPEPEELGYSSHGIRKKRNAQVDVVI